MKNQLKANFRLEDTIAVISLSGEVTTFSEQEINRVYQMAVNQKASKLLFNFDKVDYINSAGIAILIGIVTDSRKKSIPFHICGLTPHFKKIFKMVGITQYTVVFEQEAEALEKLKEST